MKYYLYINLKRKKLAHLLLILALLLIFVFIPLVVSSLQNINQQVQSDISYYSRGSYDLLVRPKDSENAIEKAKKIVHENYIGFGEGGISVEQWQKIKARADVEIAAPVASIGYFTGVSSNVGIFSSNGSSRYSLQFKTTDGVNDYPLGNEQVCIFLKSPKLANLYMDFESLINDINLLNSCNGVASFNLPSTYQLIVGIDAKEEKKLTGIPFDFEKKGMGSTAKNALDQQNIDASVIPIIEIENNDVSLEAELKVDTLNISENDTKKLRDKLGLISNPELPGPTEFIHLFNTQEYNNLFHELNTLSEKESKNIDVNLGAHLKSFEQHSLFIENDGTINNMDLSGNTSFYGLTDLNNATNYYLASPLKYEINGESISINIKDYQNGVPIYRDTKQKGMVFNPNLMEKEENRKKIQFISDPIGTIKISGYKEKLSSSPLGIYQFAPVYYIGDTNSKPIKMKPTITPGSFVTSPAKGVTTIESAVAVKGEYPIDAIRVKVAGINTYTKDSANKIDNIAKEIESMGLSVSVVAGASPQKLKVNVEGVGLVEESWTTLGAAGSIVSEWNLTNIILAALFLFVTLIYIVNRMYFWGVTNKKDIILLQQLGWERKYILGLARIEMTILMIVAFILSLPVIIVFQTLIDLPNNLFLWNIISVFFTWLIVFFMLKHNIQVGIKSKSQLSKNTSVLVKRSNSLVIKNLIFFISHIRSPFFQLLLVSALSTFVYLSLTETVEQTNLTLLGEYINVQASYWHFFLIIAAYILALFTLNESLLSLLTTRKREIVVFSSIGWKLKHIKQLYIKEILIWAGLAIAIGNILSGLFYLVLFPMKFKVIYVLIVSFLGSYGLVLLIAFLVIHRFLSKK